MDSAPASLPSTTRDGSSPAAVATLEDDAALSIAAGLAKEAASLFQAGKFVDCLRILNQLLQKKDDPKVLHNIAIAENFQNGYSDPKKLLESLENIKKQSEKLVHATEEHLEVTSNEGRKFVAVTKGTSNVEVQSSRSSVVYSDKFHASVARFNIAVIWFHLHEYGKSFSYLDAVYQNIEPIDEGTALHICLLLLDVALLCDHAARSADVISYMEKVFFVSSSINQVENGASAQQQSLLVPKSASLPGNSTIYESTHSDSSINANTLENSLTRTLSEEALEDESLHILSSLDISGQNLRRSGNASASDLPRNPVEDSLSMDDLRHKLHLYKVRFFLLTRNLKAAKREVKMAMNLAHGKDYAMALYLKSELEYARRNYRKAIKLLMASNNLTETGISTMYHNNLGCIYYQLGKIHTSGLFFVKALKNSSIVRKEKNSKLLTVSKDKSLLISYNCGMHFLACGRPFHAVHCFQKASLIFYNRPLLWLRIAECCLMALEKGLIKSDVPASDRRDVRVGVIGKGKWRELALRYGMSSNGQWDVGHDHDHFLGDDCKKFDLSLPLARKCLMNALHLMDSSEAKGLISDLEPVTEESESKEAIQSQSTDRKTVAVTDQGEPDAASASIQPNSNGEVKELKGGNNQNVLQNSISDFEYIQIKENQMVKQSTLADLAYVELSLGNPLKALAMAKSLLKLPECSRIHTFLGTVYAAESLCLLNQPAEAAKYLMMYISHGNHVELPYSQEDCEKWKVQKVVDNDYITGGTTALTSASLLDKSWTSLYSSPEEARGVFCANYAANLALLGDLEQAHHFVTKALSDTPNSPEALVTAIYLDLTQGKSHDALAKLKQHGAVRFFPGSVP